MCVCACVWMVVPTNLPVAAHETDSCATRARLQLQRHLVAATTGKSDAVARDPVTGLCSLAWFGIPRHSLAVRPKRYKLSPCRAEAYDSDSMKNTNEFLVQPTGFNDHTAHGPGKPTTCVFAEGRLTRREWLNGCTATDVSANVAKRGS